MVKLAYLAHSGDLMRAKRAQSLRLHYAPSLHKDFCWSACLLLQNRVFCCSLFSEFFVLQNCAFCSFRRALHKKFKIFWTLEASPPDPHGGRAHLRESPELPALHYALFRSPNTFSSFGSWRVRTSTTFLCKVCFKRYLTPISLCILKNRPVYLLCKASLRIPLFCPWFIYHIEHSLSGISGICIFSSKLTTYGALVRVV